MKRLKADLHVHTADDPRDRLTHSSEMLIDAAAALGFEVLALTAHDACIHSPYLDTFARRRGVLLIPGIEKTIEGKHVVILNPSQEHLAARHFEALRAAPRDDALVMAPHPFYPTPRSLGRKLLDHIDLFDAVEYSTLYCRGLNPNRRAARVARKFGLPLVGTSDVHRLPYGDSTHSWIEADKNVGQVLASVRAGRVDVVTRPLPARPALRSVYDAARGLVQDRLRGTP